MNKLAKRKNNSLKTKRQPKDWIFSSPTNTFERLFNSFDDIFDSIWDGGLLRSDLMNNLTSQETENEHIIYLQALGIDKDNININIDGDTIEIKGKTSDNSYIKNSIYYKFKLPAYIESENISAKMNNGVLELIAPKNKNELEEDNVKTIEIE